MMSILILCIIKSINPDTLLPTESSSLDLPLPDPKQICLREVERFDPFFSLAQSGEETRVMETPSFGFHHMPSPQILYGEIKVHIKILSVLWGNRLPIRMIRARCLVFWDESDIKSFEKCVVCMSGKMARKPYSHQVERAKDLLGLIHTNICGPFKIMSRQGVYYFVTFTDDFSRYGYVYLLKHKHEVFETFKVFQKEVEKQHGKTIKSLRSDRGGDLGKPANYKAALLDPESNKWLNVINVEMQSMKDYEV
nr:retrotransposon protein, putative, Ty1-copia subclass [Tanacetum cinerariifolium]